MEKITLRHAGMFKPGQSGNPNGRPKADHTIQALAKEHTEAALNTLVSIANDPSASDSARVQACTVLLDRGWGKPIQTNQNLNYTETYYDFLLKIVETEGLDKGQELLQ